MTKNIKAHATTTTGKAPVMKPRRDATGHLNPKYAAELREQSASPPTGNEDAFLHRAGSNDALAEELGEEAVKAATMGGEDAGESLDAILTEEVGGPFVPSAASSELAEGGDDSNPRDATREPLPRTLRRTRDHAPGHPAQRVSACRRGGPFHPIAAALRA